MQDNFNIHSWRLNQAINEDKSLQVNITDDDWSQSIAYKISDALIKAGYSRDMIKQVAKAILTRPSLQEVEEATFTDKFDDNPKLKGGQKDLPDEVQAQIVAEGSYENYDIFMDGVLDVLVKDKIITKADVDALNRGEDDDLMDVLHDVWEGFIDYEETGQAISRSDLNLAARAIAKKIGKLKENKVGENFSKPS